MLTKLPPPPSQSIVICQFRVYGDVKKTSLEKVLKYSAFCRKILKTRSYATTLADFPIIEEWVEAVMLSAFGVMPYPYTIIYNPKIVSARYIVDFFGNIVQYAVLSRCPVYILMDLFHSFGSHFTTIDNHCMNDNATLFNVAWPVNKSSKMIQGNLSENPKKVYA